MSTIILLIAMDYHNVRTEKMNNFGQVTGDVFFVSEQKSDKLLGFVFTSHFHCSRLVGRFLAFYPGCHVTWMVLIAYGTQLFMCSYAAHCSSSSALLTNYRN